ncbi:hypothetical protein AB0D73_29460 [Streptomyces sp. NPDC048215]
MTTRTVLPRNLTRHYWNAVRAKLADEGKTVEPWYKLSEEVRAAVVVELDVFRQAIRAAEEEEDLIAALDASQPAPAREQSAATTTDGSDDCLCSGCSAVAAFLKLFGPGAALRPEDSGPRPAAFAFRIVPLGNAAMTAEEKTRVKKSAREAIDKWVAAGKPLNVATDLDTFTGIRIPEPFDYTYADLRSDMVKVQSLRGIVGNV